MRPWERGGRDRLLPLPPWLAETYRALCRLEGRVPLVRGTACLAWKLLGALELDDLPAPHVAPVGTGRIESGLIFTWATPPRWLILEVVGADRFCLGVRAGRGELRCRYHPARGLDGVNELRKAIGELYRDAYPECDAARVAEGRT